MELATKNLRILQSLGFSIKKGTKALLRALVSGATLASRPIVKDKMAVSESPCLEALLAFSSTQLGFFGKGMYLRDQSRIVLKKKQPI